MINRNLIFYSLLSLLILFLISCSDQQQPTSLVSNLRDAQTARETLVRFLAYLHNGKYEEAVQLYGGSYQTMLDQNPTLSTNDYAGLFRNACTHNGMQCLQVKSVHFVNKISSDEFLFTVSFVKADGTLFVRESCCGGDDADITTQEAFNFSVLEIEPDRFVVLSLPPYGP